MHGEQDWSAANTETVFMLQLRFTDTLYLEPLQSCLLIAITLPLLIQGFSYHLPGSGAGRRIQKTTLQRLSSMHVKRCWLYRSTTTACSQIPRSRCWDFWRPICLQGSTTSVGAILYVAMQVYESAHLRKFCAVHHDFAQLRTDRFLHVPSDYLLLRFASGQCTLSADGRTLELDVEAHAVFQMMSLNQWH